MMGLQDQGHHGEDFLGVADWPEHQAPRRLGERRPGTPLETQPFDEQAGAGAFQGSHAVLDGAPSHSALAPIGWDGTDVLGWTGACWDDFGHGGLQQPHADVHAVAIRAAVVDVENVEEERGVVSGPTPPGDPGQQVVAAKGDPHPFRAATAGGEVVGQFLVEHVGQSREEVEFFAPDDRAHGQVLLFHGQGTLQVKAPVRSWVRRSPDPCEEQAR